LEISAENLLWVKLQIVVEMITSDPELDYVLGLYYARR